MFDIAVTTTLYLEAAAMAKEKRRKTVDDAIADFHGAIGNVIDAIKEASGSLTTTSAIMQRVADETLAEWLRLQSPRRKPRKE